MILRKRESGPRHEHKTDNGTKLSYLSGNMAPSSSGGILSHSLAGLLLLISEGCFSFTSSSENNKHYFNCFTSLLSISVFDFSTFFCFSR